MNKAVVDYIYNDIRTIREKCYSTKKEIALLLSCREAGDYTPMFTTKLYIKHGPEYCMLLEKIHHYFKGGNQS